MPVRFLAKAKPFGDYPIADTEDIQHGTKRLDVALSDIETVNERKADKTYVDTELAKKADSTTVSALDTRVSTNETNIANLSNYVTPEMFGAKGDGVINDATAIKECLESGKKSSLSSNKTYLIKNSITVSNLDCIYIDGCGCTLATYNLEKAFGITNCHNIIIKNLVIDGSNSTTRVFNFTDCSNIVFENVTIKNVHGVNSSSNNIRGCAFENCSDILFNKCIIKNIDGSGSNGEIAKGLWFGRNGENSSKRIEIVDCLFDTIMPFTDADAIHFNGYKSSDDYSARVSNCVFIDCAKRSVKCQCSNVIVENCTIYDVNYTGTEHGAGIEFFGSFSKAINNHIVLTNSRRSITIVCGDDEPQHDLEINGNYIEFTGGTDTAKDCISIGYVANSILISNVNIKNNTIKVSNCRYGLLAPYTINLTLDGNIIEVTDDSTVEIKIGEYFQDTVPTTKVKIINNNFINVDLITLNASHSSVINNVFEDCGCLYGDTRLTSSTDVKICDNTFQKCGYGYLNQSNTSEYYIISNNVFKETVTRDVQCNVDQLILRDNYYTKWTSGNYKLLGVSQFTTSNVTIQAGGSYIRQMALSSVNIKVGNQFVITPNKSLNGCLYSASLYADTGMYITIYNPDSESIDLGDIIWTVEFVRR